MRVKAWERRRLGARGRAGPRRQAANARRQHEQATNGPCGKSSCAAQAGLDHKHCGSLHAPDAAMAMQMARDVYTRRQEGTSIWVVPSTAITASDPATRACYFDPPTTRSTGTPASTSCRSRGPHVMRSSSDTPRQRAVPAAPGRHRPDPGPAPGEWCGHGPVLEEDIALANLALDLIGQARALLTLAGAPRPAFDEDQLAILRDERDYRNPTLVELPHARRSPARRLRLHRAAQPGGGHLLKLLWQRLQRSATPSWPPSPPRPLKEARYHQQHAADWVAAPGRRHRRIGPPHAGRAGRSLALRGELFEADAVDEAAAAAAWARNWAACARPGRREIVLAVLADAGLRAAQPTGLPQHAGRHGRAQRAHGPSAGRDAVPAARLPRRRW
jgi:ring-1,2-phenylacetyl-CoA epoxidase subunit PaaC